MLEFRGERSAEEEVSPLVDCIEGKLDVKQNVLAHFALRLRFLGP